MFTPQVFGARLANIISLGASWCTDVLHPIDESRISNRQNIEAAERFIKEMRMLLDNLEQELRQ